MTAKQIMRIHTVNGVEEIDADRLIVEGDTGSKPVGRAGLSARPRHPLEARTTREGRIESQKPPRPWPAR